MNQVNVEPNTAQSFVDASGIEYSASFVPFSKSRNADGKPCLNWRVSLSKNGTKLVTDYMQGVGHIPHYNHQFAKLVAYDDAVRAACETGKSSLRAAKNGYDACGADRIFRSSAPIPVPALTDVLFSLVMDADVLNHDSFEDWAACMGYDADSRKAEKIYRDCLEIALKLRRIVDLEAAQTAFQDY